MEIMRIIVTGSVGTGKSSLVRAVSEIKTVDMEPQATAQTSWLQGKTTIALDYGRVHFDADMSIQLYGTPGQPKFDFIWDLLMRRAHASIVLVAANRPANFRSTSRLLTFMETRVQIPMIIGLTHTDCPSAWSMEDIAIALGYANPTTRPTMVKVNPTQKTSTVQALRTLVEQYRSRKSSDSYSQLPMIDYLRSRVAA
jgi:signal recognition particle receptor subunit beta